MTKMSVRAWIIVISSTLCVLAALTTVLVTLNRLWHRPRQGSSYCALDSGYATAQWNKTLSSPDSQSQLPNPGWTPQAYEIQRACAQAEAKAFIDSDYGEIKDMGKAFLTLITAVFLASITFSEKIIDFKTAPKISTVSMFVSWIFLLASIFSCGIGLVMNLSSLMDLKYLDANPWEFEFKGVVLFFISGASFALGLTAMLIAALPVHIMQSTSAAPLAYDGE